MSKHTPGPWHYDEGDGWVVSDYPRHIICNPLDRSTNIGHEECDANAQLIAAAPDLLAALRAFVEFNDEPMGGPPSLWQAARAALAKAEA